MSVVLKKGGRVNLTKDTALKEAMLGLGWDTNRYQGSAEFDLDLVLFACDANKRCISDQYMVFYNNLHDPEYAIKHSGDNRTGEGEGDDESAVVDFSKLSSKVENIVIIISIYEAKHRNQNFGLVDNAYVRIVDNQTGEEILRYDLAEDFSIQTSVVFGELYKQNGEWKFRAVGEGYEKELDGLCAEYGISVQN